MAENEGRTALDRTAKFRHDYNEVHNHGLGSGDDLGAQNVATAETGASNSPLETTGTGSGGDTQGVAVTADPPEMSDMSEEFLDAKMAECIKQNEDLLKKVRCQEKLVKLQQLEANNLALLTKWRDLSKRSSSKRPSSQTPIGAPSKRTERTHPEIHERTHAAPNQPTGNGARKPLGLAELRTMPGINFNVDDALTQLGIQVTALGTDSGADSSGSVASGGPAVQKLKESGTLSSSDGENNCSKVSIKRRRRRKTKTKKVGSKESKPHGNGACYACGSDSDKDKRRVLWPNEFLGARYNNYGKADTKFKQLDLRMLVAGELNIVCSRSVNPIEMQARLKLLSDIVFNSAFYQWAAILKFHAAVLSEVEEGNMEWGDDYSRLEQQMLMPYPSNKAGKTENIRKSEGTRGQNKSNAAGSGSGTEDRVIFCGDFQQKNCSQSGSHNGNFFGRQAVLQHICSACWKKDRVKVAHSASSTECPWYEH